MITHAEILDLLRATFPDVDGDPGVTLVARYRDPRLALASRWTLLFVPDMHLLTDADLGTYPNYHFTKSPQGDDLEKLLGNLAELRAARPGELLVYQIGDLFDAWRSRTAGTYKEKVDAIAASFAPLIDLFRSSPPEGVKARLLAGNHDYVIHQLADWSALRFEIIPASAPGGGDVLIVHGDVFDWAEQAAPDDLQAWAVRLAADHDGGTNTFEVVDQTVVQKANEHLPQGDAPIGQDLTSFVDHGPIESALDILAIGFDLLGVDIGVDARTRFFPQAAKAARILKDHGHDIRVVVIGHTHSARMVYGDRGDGQQLLLMDCGAWFGKCRFGGGPVLWSQQIGVVSDNDLRIYQLGRNRT
jgi:UDP-2,3-diacylglucosamine pyrophosphatase LpxH